MSVADFIVNGLGLSLNDKLAGYVESDVDSVCAITGQRITEGIPWQRVIPASTAEYLDLMHGMAFPYLSLGAAAAFKGSWNMGSRLIFADGTMYHPYISAASATNSKRSYWSDLVRNRDVWPARKGQRCLCVMAGDSRKKVWPRAKIGQLGKETQVLLFDNKRFQLKNIVINWKRLIHVLDFVEEVYTAGFGLNVVGAGLWGNYAAFSADLARSMAWEQRLSKMRDLPEFQVSILIAQKREVSNGE